MKTKCIVMLLWLVLGVGALKAETLAEIFQGNESLSEIFVNPLGIRNAAETTDMDSLAAVADEAGVRFKTLDIGQFGKVLSVNPEFFSIAGIPVEKIMILARGDMNCVIYMSVQSDNSIQMCDWLNKELSPYSKSATSEKPESQARIHMLSDKYGIGIGQSADGKRAMAMLMDMKNLNEFLSGKYTPID